MNDLDRKMAEEEYRRVTEWVLEEEIKVDSRLKKEGEYAGGLDGRKDEYSYIYEERNRRISEIRKKYGIG